MAEKIEKDTIRATVGMLRINYPKGTRVELMKMDDIQAPPIGTQGTVTGVDDIGTIMVDWDNGSKLGVVLGEDICRKIMLMYGKEASNRKQEIDRQHYTIPNQRPKDKHCGKI